MDIPLKTIDVWQLEGTIEPRTFLSALPELVKIGDIMVFAAYEPTESLTQALLPLGGVQRGELPRFYTSFHLNREEHPNGCAFEFSMTESWIASILSLPDDLLRQKDIPLFYDHFIAYRPGHPEVPLMTFHDASCGGTLFLSGLFSETEVATFSTLIGLKPNLILNPVLNYLKDQNNDATM